MLDKAYLVKYLRESLVLKAPDVETDPAYKFTDDMLYDILVMQINTHNSDYTEKSFPDNELPFLVLLAKKEVYYRLATASAPFYPLEAEGASLRKDYRFEHYMSLIRIVNNEYAMMWGSFEGNQPIRQGELLVSTKHFTGRNYNLSKPPTVNLKAVTIRTDSVDLEWDKFECIGGMFCRYSIYASETIIYDEFEYLVDEKAKVAEVRDIHKTKFRLKDLQSGKHYYILVVSEDLNTIKGYSQIEIDMLP